MFMVWSKDKILSYLVSLGTVTLLFVMSYAITTKNDEILKTSANAVKANEYIETDISTNSNQIDSKNAVKNETIGANTIKNTSSKITNTTSTNKVNNKIEENLIN